jgi:hypothetical protein
MDPTGLDAGMHLNGAYTPAQKSANALALTKPGADHLLAWI